MQVNPGPSVISRVAFDGANSRAIDISNYNSFGFVLEVTADIVTDAVFNILAHPGTAADACIADTGVAVPLIEKCSDPAFVAGNSQIVIPAGTVAGTIIVCTLPCRPDRYVSLQAVSGSTANVLGTVTLGWARS